ncbi:hypothetical protein PoB_007619800 [Plakobranchus ocellatus]|uniref:Uncharacterized protein n=1 Tax=Plakobranchus ocellatus TaxID=259542 RepID=A0AAV4DZA9_9GAST|nr:hypothetical protein PoB_007619800 [Plakobranchus ocellatus]
MAVATMLLPRHCLDSGQEAGLGLKSVVRGAVDNMEFVLRDLTSIMGNIQSLVAHIDSVTCRSGRRNRRRRGKSQERQDKQGRTESEGIEESRQEDESNPSHDGPGNRLRSCPSSSSSSSATRLCPQKPAGVDSVRGGSSLAEAQLHGQTENAFSRVSGDGGDKMKMISTRFSDSTLQEASNPSFRGNFRASYKANASSRKFSRFSQPNTLLQVEQSKFCSQTQEIGAADNVDKGSPFLSHSQGWEELKTKWRSKREYRVEADINFGSSLTKRPIYLHHARDDSTASRGEYDLETKEAILGSRTDFSDGDLSRWSLEDSPLRLKHSNKREKDWTAVSGTVAVVHPMVKTLSNQSSPTKRSLADVSDDIDFYGRHRVCKPAYRSSQVFQIGIVGQINNIPDDYEIPLVTALGEKDSAHKSRHRYVYNKSFLPVTPTEQNTLNTVQKRLGSLSRSSKHVNSDIIQVPNIENLQFGNVMNHNSLPNSPKLRRSTEVRVGFDLDTFETNQKRLIPRPVYARIDGSPASTRSSCSTVRKPVAHHYYYSIDSDLDSDIVPDHLDPRILTPDLDWSYLNLMGSGEILGLTAPEIRRRHLDNSYETPVTLLRGQNLFESSKSTSDDIPLVPFYHVLGSKNSSPLTDDTSKERDELGDHFEEPVLSLLSCKGVGSQDTQGYCGCYEALLDSVLENVAGFDTFEEALDQLSNDDILNETYISFDDQFEEDDWDVGLGSDHSQGFAVNHSLVYLGGSDDGNFSDLFSERSFDASKDLSARIINRPCVLSLSKTAASNFTLNERALSEKSRDNKRKRCTLSNVDEECNVSALPMAGHQVKRLNDIQFSLDSSFQKYHTGSIGASSYQKDSNPSLTDDSKEDDQNSSFVDDDDDDDGPDMMTASYDISCQAVASDSPMSLCSSDAPATSPLSGRFITSSEGDDLFTSHDESYFLLSPTSPSSGTLDNAREAQAFGRTRASELTQQFLLSLREICERHRSSSGDGISSSASDGVSNLNLSGNRDSSSSALSSNNSSTITASTSTATDATLTDDNMENNSLQVACPRRETVLCPDSDSPSLNDDTLTGSRYNRNVNTWTAYAVVNVPADDVSDGTSSDAFYNENNILGSMHSVSSALLDNDNADLPSENQKPLL